ncbi:POK9 protein, partial [Halcyon senegalensis]|nr:POK9 protein [Halcyon senegalensis]
RARSAVSQYGLRSQLAQQIIRYIFTADTLLPLDSVNIAEMLGCLDTLLSATTGSAGVDLATAVEVTLQDTGVRLIDSNAKGPLGHGLNAFLIGQSSTSRQGIFVIPGIIDADYQGIVKIIVCTLIPPVLISKGSRIAQLISFNACVPRPGNKTREDGGFGSTGPPQVYLSMDIGKAKPECVVEMESKNGQKRHIKMLIDTGADVTIISGSQWPPSWPTVTAPTGIFGIGGTQSTRVS